MFFIASKILSFFTTPVIWIGILLLLALLCEKQKRKKRFLRLSAILFFFFTNSFIIDEILRIWEISAIKTEELDPPYDYGIVLGGMVTYDVEYKRINFVTSTDRLLQAIDLYHQKKIKKFFITGGSGSFTNREMKEALLLEKYMAEIGIPENDICIETESKNTYENAIYTAQILSREPNKKLLLITSAVHLRRSIGCFKKAGINAKPYSTDRKAGPRKFNIGHLFVPDVGALSLWTIFLHEFFGYIVYKVMGYL